jgi:hypothetical protein
MKQEKQRSNLYLVKLVRLLLKDVKDTLDLSANALPALRQNFSVVVH